MHCQHDDTELKVFAGTIDIFGPGTCIMKCPTCQDIIEYSDTGEFSLRESERTLICNGFRAQIRRTKEGLVPKRGCTCPMCETFIRVEEKPPTAVQNYYMDAEDIVTYLRLQDGDWVCKCYECKYEFYVFPNDVIHIK